MYCFTSLTHMQDECFSCQEWTFSHPRFQSCSLELCALYLMYVGCTNFGKFGHEQFWFLSFFEHAAWSRMAAVLLLCLSSHSGCHLPSLRLKSSSCYIIITCTMSCCRCDFCNRQKVHAFISLNDQGYGFELCGNVAYMARLGWTFTPNISILLLKEGSVVMLLGVQHVLFAWAFTSSQSQQPWWGTIALGGVFCTFFNWWLQTASKMFKYILLEIVNTLEKWAVTAWECSIGALVWVQLLNFRNIMVHCTCNQSDLSCWQKTQQTSKSA